MLHAPGSCPRQAHGCRSMDIGVQWGHCQPIVPIITSVIVTRVSEAPPVSTQSWYR